MHENSYNTILLVCTTEDKSARLIDCLTEAGFGVIGPAGDAATALALTAQTPPTAALLACQPSGRRKARRLAEELVQLWGVPSWILPQAIEDESLSPVAVQGSDPIDFSRLRRALRAAEGAVLQ